MPQKHKTRYTPAAADDIDEIFSYISKENIATAEELLIRIDEGISQLSSFPYMGSVLSDEEYKLVKRGYRFIVIPPYLVFYRIVEKTIIVHRILHSRRDYVRELFTFED